MPGRVLRSAGTVLVSLLLTTCTENPTAPNRPGPGVLAVVPVLPPSAKAAGLSFDNVHLVVVRPPSTKLLDKQYNFPANSSTFTISENLLLQGSSEDLTVTLEYRSGTTVLLSGTQTVTVLQGPPGTGSPTNIPLTLQVGQNVAAITIAPDTAYVQINGTTTFTVSAVDGQGNPVAQFYEGWDSGDPSQPIDANGVFHAGPNRDTVTITATALTGTGTTSVNDVAVVIVQAAPGSLVLTGGDQQTGSPGTVLPQLLAVQLLGTDGRPLVGQVVSFAATSGGGSVDSLTATTDAQGIARTHATLGPGVGQNTFTATFAGLTPVVFTATAAGISPAPVPMAAGGDHSCEIRSGGLVYCWGSNSDGELGDGTTTDRLVATPVLGGISFVALALGSKHSCALQASGSAYCWGDNANGALGDGTTSDRSFPTLVGGGHNFARIAAGDGFTCGITTAAQAFCWGRNQSGQLGDGTISRRLNPRAVFGGLAFKEISTGGDHTCALDLSGNGYCWGKNLNGQLGTGNLADQLSPTTVGGGITFTDISVGDRSSCALDVLGDGYCWGYNFGLSITNPQPVGGGRTYGTIDMGGDHVCGLNGSGLFCGGNNANGQLGDGTTTDQPNPVQVVGGFTFTAFGAGSQHTCGATSTGPKCWGANNRGQLGDGSTTPHLTPASAFGPAATVALDQGDNQVVVAGSAVPIPPSVLVTDGQGAPLPGAEVIFAVASGGGSITAPVALTSSSGIAAVGSWTLGLGANSLVATVSSSNVTGNPVQFNATGTSVGGSITWTGATNTSWFTATNWSPQQVPTSTDNAVIPGGTANQPTVNGNPSVNDLTLASTGVLTLGTNTTFTVNGDLSLAGAVVDLGNSQLVLAGTGRTWTGPAQTRVVVLGTYSLSGAAAATDLTVQGAAASFDLNGNGLSLSGNFNTTTGAVLISTHAGDGLLVLGNATFDGGDETGKLTNGLLSVQGSFSQLSSTSPNSFFATNAHVTQLGAVSNQSVLFTTPAKGAAGSHFRHLDITPAAGGLTLNSNVFATGNFTALSGTPNTLTGAPSTVTLDVNGVSVTSLTLDNVLLVVGTGTLAQLNSITFANTPTTATALTISQPGAATAFSLTNLVFQTTPTTGAYINATDTNPTDGLVFTLDLFAPTPAAPSGFVVTNGGAVVNWPAGAGAITWNGSVSNQYGTAANWTPAQVPTATDNVLVPAGTPNPLQTGLARTLNDLTVQPGATFTVNGGVLVTVNGNVDVQGTVVDASGTGALVLAGTGKTVQGNIQGPVVTGTYSLSGPLVVPSDIIIRGDLTINGQVLSLSTDLLLLSAGRIFMTNPTDQVFVGGNAFFTGGSTSGALTEGNLFIQGNLTQNNSGTGLPANSFSPSGNHTTWFSGSGVQQVDIFNTGTGSTASHFANLNLSLATGSIDLVRFNTVFVEGTLTSTPAGTPPVFTSSNSATLQVAGVDINGLVFDRIPVTLFGGPIASFNRVTFQNYTAADHQMTFHHAGAATPFTFDQLTFTTVPSGSGLYLQANDIAPTDGLVFTIDLTNPSPATSGGFAQTIGGAVINWPVSSNFVTWLGTTSTDWNTPANWNPARVPTATDGVMIPAGTPNGPLLTSNAQTNDLTVQTSATLDLATFTLFAQGDVDASGTLQATSPGQLAIQGAGRAVRGNILADVDVGGSYTLMGNLIVSGFLRVSGTFSVLDVGGFTATVGGDFSTLSSGLLIMTNPAGQLAVTGNASFDGANELGFMSAGVFGVSGNLTQLNNNSDDSFHPSGSHLTLLTGASPTVTFATPGIVPGSSHFQELSWTGGGTLTLGSDAFAHGTFSGFTGGVSSSGRTLSVGGLNWGGTVVFNNTPLVINQPAGLPLTLDNVTFQGMASTATQLTVNHPGFGGPFTFNNLTFSGTPTTGFYLSANDVDGPSPTPLQLNLTNAVPASPGTFVQSLNGAQVTWNGQAAVVTWTGAVDNTWSNGGNWSGGVAPTASDSVEIPATANQPQLNTNISVGAVRITGGNLTLNGHNLTVARSFITTGTGVLTMTNAGDGLTVNGDATFGGGDETGLLDQGVFILRGNFSQLAGSFTSFVGTGGHVTILDGGTPQSVSFSTPGATQSRFQNLQIANTSGIVTLIGTVVALGAADVTTTTNVGGGTADLEAGTVSTVVGSALNLAGLTMRSTSVLIGGTMNIPNITFIGGASLPVLAYQNLVINLPSGTMTVSATTSTTGNLVVQGGGLILGGQTMTVGGSFFTTASGVLVSNSDTDQLTVAGSVNFGGADETGLISLGTITVAGNFNQTNSVSKSSFVAGPSHTTVFNGTSASPQTVSFADSLLSQFGSVSLTNTAQLTSASLPLISGNLDLGPGTVLSASNQASNGTGFNVAGNLTTGNPTTITLGRFYLAGAMNIAVASGYVVTSTILTGTGQTADPNLSYQNLFIAGTVTLGPSTPQISGTLTVNSGSLTLTGNADVFGNTVIAAGTLLVNGRQLTVHQDLATSGTGLLNMTNAADIVTVAGKTTFDGGDETGLLTAGVLSAQGDFIQLATNSASSFAAGGTHKTSFGFNAPSISFASPGAAASHFQDLELLNGITCSLGSGIQATGKLTSFQATQTIKGNGNTVNVQSVGVQAMTVDNAKFVIDEGATGVAEQFDNVTFANYPTTGTTMLVFIGPGGAAAPRTVTFDKTTFQTLPVGAGNLYVQAVSNNGFGLNLNLTNSNQSPRVSGNGPTLSDPPNQQTVAGATILWP